MIIVAHSVGPNDHHLASQIAAQLAETNWPSLKRLSVNVHGSMVKLRGSVGSYYEKQLAINTCRVLAGSERLIDAAEVAAAY